MTGRKANRAAALIGDAARKAHRRLHEDELAVPGDPDCPYCHGRGDCLECDPGTAWK